MANFVPLKHYMFYCLDKLVSQYRLTEPFLDVGCGVGDVSRYIAVRYGWHGTAIDASELAAQRAVETLQPYGFVKVLHRPLADESGLYATILLWDIVEHVEDDRALMHQVARRLLPGGYAAITVPSNPHEWRWDDDFYGHYRRYTKHSMSDLLCGAGLEPVVLWDFTWPVFWMMRRLYTRLKAPPFSMDSKELRTARSSTVNAWQMPMASLLSRGGGVLWRLIYDLQFRLRYRVERGHEMFVLARKPVDSSLVP